MPATSPIQLLDTVALLTDVPELGLSAGEVGAIVGILSSDAFEVEFRDESAYAYGLHTLRAHQLVRLLFPGTGTRGRVDAVCHRPAGLVARMESLRRPRPAVEWTGRPALDVMRAMLRGTACISRRRRRGFAVDSLRGCIEWIRHAKRTRRKNCRR